MLIQLIHQVIILQGFNDVQPVNQTVIGSSLFTRTYRIKRTKSISPKLICTYFHIQIHLDRVYMNLTYFTVFLQYLALHVYTLIRLCQGHHPGIVVNISTCRYNI